MVWSILVGKEVADTYVSTDSQEYGEIAYRAGAKVVYREEAPEGQGDLEVVRHFLEHVSADIICYLRPTTPLREVSVVKGALGVFEGTGLRSVQEMGESAYKCFEVEAERLKPICHNIIDDYTDVSNHLCPKTYHPNGYVDLIRSEWVKNDNLWGPDKQAYITPRVIEIDTEDDWEYAEWYVQRNPPVTYTIGYERL
jgi:CMP-N,N'-diacetyllegionaminic acid synthase